MQDKMGKFLIMVLSMVEVIFTMIWQRVQKRWWDLNGKLHFSSAQYTEYMTGRGEGVATDWQGWHLKWWSSHDSLFLDMIVNGAKLQPSISCFVLIGPRSTRILPFLHSMYPTPCAQHEFVVSLDKRHLLHIDHSSLHRARAKLLYST